MRIPCAKHALALLMLSAAPHAPAEIIDRIAVSVGNRVIAASDIDREIRVVAFLDGKPLDFSPAARRATAERLVDQKLIQRELETSRYPASSPSEVEPALAKFRKEYLPDDAVYRRTLAEYGVSEQNVRDELLWQRTLTLFVGQRFRLGAEAGEQEIRDYFDKVVKPGRGGAAALEDHRSAIEEALAQQREARETDVWIQQARERTEIVYHDEAFQ